MIHICKSLQFDKTGELDMGLVLTWLACDNVVMRQGSTHRHLPMVIIIDFIQLVHTDFRGWFELTPVRSVRDIILVSELYVPEHHYYHAIEASDFQALLQLYEGLQA